MKRPTQYSSSQAAQHQAMMNCYQNAATTATGTNAFATAFAIASPSQIYLTVPAGTTAVSMTQTTAGTCSTIVAVPPFTSSSVGCPTDPSGRNWNPDIYIRDGGPVRTIHFPDGTKIDVKTDGSFSINDKDAKVTYRANRVREFNSYLNASDKLEAFIKFCGKLGIKQDQMLDMPIKAFIGWLVVEAAAADGEDTDYKQLTAELRTVGPQPRDSRGRFMRRRC